MKNFIILLMAVFILSCATGPQISDDGFISSQPNFQVQFNKPIVKKSIDSRRFKDGSIKAYIFSVNNMEAVLIQIVTYFPGTRLDYYYGPEQFLTNLGRMVLDPVVIDGRQWIKFVDVSPNNKSLFTGYCRFMDQSFISVGRICNASAYSEEIGSFRSGASLKYAQGKLWDDVFAQTDQLFSLGKVEPAESQSEKPLSAKEVQTTPEKTKTETERPPLEKETPKVASISKDVSDAGISLRKEPMEIKNETKIAKMLVKYGFFDIHKNPFSSFENDLVDNNDGTVTDKATGLMWQKSGSSTYLNNWRANDYVEQLNQERFAGHSDWRMPTIEELASLLSRSSNNGVHLAPEFGTHQISCWSADKCYVQFEPLYYGYWIVNFKQGQILETMMAKPSHANSPTAKAKNETNYVKAVRSVR